MTNVAPVAPAQRKLSLACLFSFIFGLLGCIPFAGGGLAILFAIVGFIATGNPMKKGRWMAVIGLLLGIMSIAGWGLFGGSIMLLISATKAPRVATHDYIQYLAAGDTAGALAHSSGITPEETQALSDYAKAHGTFKDTTFTNTSINNSDATVSGSADFSGGPVDVEAALHEDGSVWKVTTIKLKDNK